MNKRFYTFVSILIVGIYPASVFAQTEDDDEQVYELTPFNVDESQDMGYTATNTLSGHQRVSLKYVLSSIYRLLEIS